MTSEIISSASREPLWLPRCTTVQRRVYNSIAAIPFVLCAFGFTNVSEGQGSGGGLASPGTGPESEMLARRIASIKSQIRVIESQVSRIQQRMPTVETELDRLIGQLGQVKLPEPEDEEVKGSQLRQVPFRPPFLREVEGAKTTIAVVCQEGRVSILDFEESGRQLDRLIDNKSSLKKLIDDKTATLAAGDFEVIVSIVPLGNLLLFMQKAQRKKNSVGEPIRDALRRSSRIRSRLAKLNGEEEVIQFVVYPDSFDVFRQMREVVWESKFSVNWEPLKHGGSIRIGGGPASAQ